MAFNLVQIIGKKTEEVVLYNEELRVKSTEFLQVIAEKYSRKTIAVFNSLDVDVLIGFGKYTPYYKTYVWDGEKNVNLDNEKITIPANSYVNLDNHPMWMTAKNLAKFRIVIETVDVPTTGVLEIEIHGVIN